MKKYVKPELIYERYVLSEQIARCAYDLAFENGACEGKGYLGTDAGYPGDWILIATTGVDGCQFEIEEYCYQPGEDGYNTFNS